METGIDSEMDSGMDCGVDSEVNSKMVFGSDSEAISGVDSEVDSAMEFCGGLPIGLPLVLQANPSNMLVFHSFYIQTTA